MPQQPKHSKEFGELVRRLTDGWSDREAARETGPSSTYIGLMRGGDIPSYDIVTRFADGLAASERGLTVDDRARLFTLAGYVDRFLNGAQRLAQGIAELSDRYGRPVPIRLQGGREALTLEEAESVLADAERLLEQGIL